MEYGDAHVYIYKQMSMIFNVLPLRMYCSAKNIYMSGTFSFYGDICHVYFFDLPLVDFATHCYDSNEPDVLVLCQIFFTDLKFCDEFINK